MANDIRHSSESALWLTPPDICVRVQKVFGGLPNLDPASSRAANIFVGARRILTEKDDALVTPWNVTVTDALWLNPPGGVDAERRSLQGRFWARLMEHRGQFGHAMFMCFNLNIFQVSQAYSERSVVSFPFVVLKSRLRFWKYDERGDLIEGGSPTHPSAVVYVPGRFDRTEVFRDVFRDAGAVVVPRDVPG